MTKSECDTQSALRVPVLWVVQEHWLISVASCTQNSFLGQFSLGLGQDRMLSSSVYYKISKFSLHLEGYPGFSEGA